MLKFDDGCDYNNFKLSKTFKHGSSFGEARLSLRKHQFRQVLVHNTYCIYIYIYIHTYIYIYIYMYIYIERERDRERYYTQIAIVMYHVYYMIYCYSILYHIICGECHAARGYDRREPQGIGRRAVTRFANVGGYVHVYIYIYTYIHTYIHIHVYTYIYIYI